MATNGEAPTSGSNPAETASANRQEAGATTAATLRDRPEIGRSNDRER